MDIAEVKQLTGMSASALRFYEAKGLISSNGRRGLRRQYPPAVLERLALIALGRSAGFSLEEIGHMFAIDGAPQIHRQLLADKADELDRSIEKLAAVRDGLRHAAACPALSHMECPSFRRLLAKAAHPASEAKRAPSPRGAAPPPRHPRKQM